MSVGPAPRQQTSWDARAAGNFICGGAGSGLIVFTALSGEEGIGLAVLMLAGLALVGAGLCCVWLEIGRPLRALHVFFNPRTSWMTREAFAAALLFPSGLAVVVGIPAMIWPAAALALAFVYCQSRMLRAARGIPAWREPLLSPLIVLTGLVEGGGLFFAGVGLHRGGAAPVLALFGALVLARVLVWLVYRWRVGATAVPQALDALDTAGRVLQLAGTVAPLALIALATFVAMSGASLSAVMSAGGLLAAVAGAWMKYVLITRAGFNQGFALRHLPVRGTRPQLRDATEGVTIIGEGEARRTRWV